MNISGVGELGVGETGVGEMGQIIGETGVGEMGVGETGTSRFSVPVDSTANITTVTKKKKQTPQYYQYSIRLKMLCQ